MKMTPKEKAKELLDKFDIKHYHSFGLNGNEFPVSMYEDQIKQCSLIYVDELLTILKSLKATKETLKEYRYYLEVKTEINKL